MFQEIRFRASVLIIVFIVTGILSSCNLPGAAKADLEGTRWQVETIDGAAPAAGVVITAEFNDGRISGSAGCNSYGAAYSAKDGSLSLEAVASTQMYCVEEGVMDAEAQFLGALGKVKGYSTANDRLELTDESGKVLMSFTKQ